MNRVNGSKKAIFLSALFLSAFLFSAVATAATSIPLTLTMSEPVIVTGTPRVAVDVGGQTRYAPYTAGSNTTTLTFTLTPQAGDVDLDGITISSPIDLNGGTLKDATGNNAALTFTPPNTSGIKVNYPSLGMDFTYDADGRYTLNGTAYNDLSSFLTAASGTFTRASIGTYYDSAGTLQTATSDTPRFDWDPVTHAPKGLLIEESRTNMTTYSSQLDTASWGKPYVTVTANAIAAPDGNLSAELVTCTGGGLSYISNIAGLSFAAGDTVSRSIYAKAGTSSKVIIEYNDGATWGATVYNLSTSVVTAATGVTARIVSVGNGWYRLLWTKTFTTGSPTSLLRAYYIDTYGTGAAGQSIYLWGAQTEIGAFPTSYIPTTTAAVTRAADTLAISTASWFSNSQGSFDTKYDITGFTTTTARQYVMGTGASSDSGVNRLNLRGWDGSGVRGPEGVVGDGTTNSTLYVAGAYSGPEKATLAYSASDSAFSRNGSAATTGTAYSGLAVSSVYVGALTTASNALNGHLVKFKYYPSRVPNTQLQLLTQ